MYINIYTVIVFEQLQTQILHNYPSMNVTQIRGFDSVTDAMVAIDWLSAVDSCHKNWQLKSMTENMPQFIALDCLCV